MTGGNKVAKQVTKTIDKIVDMLKFSLEGKITHLVISGNEIYADMPREFIYDACVYTYRNIDCNLMMLYASDERKIDGCFRVSYGFSVSSAGIIITYRASLHEKDLVMQSISGTIPAASLYEREVQDMFGISFHDHPDNRELVFHGNWPSDLHPLNKDFDTGYRPPFVDREQEFLRIQGSGVFEIPVGPVHAGVIEPGHFRFSVAGEPIINLEAKLYFVHKGIEKLAENQSFEKVFFLSERISGDETINNSLAYSQAVEKLAGLENLPERALYTRTILSELERIYNHLGDIAGICTDVAYGFGAAQFNMMRRWCLMLNEELTGSRFMRSSIRPGGIRKEFIKGKESVLLENMDKLDKEFRESILQLKCNSLFVDRIENTGLVKPETAIDLNAVGPAARAVGIDRDVRRDFPYAAYEHIDFKVQTNTNGDVGHRMLVKIDELLESIGIIRQCIEKMPAAGPVFEDPGRIMPYKYAYSLTESPRGENCHWLMSGENNTVFRYKVRTPSFNNWPVLCHAVKGNVVPDFPLINKSFNLSYSGNDL